MKILAINQAAASEVNKDVEKLSGAEILACFPEELAESRMEKIRKVVQLGQPLRFEDQYDKRVMDNRIYPLFDSEGKVERLAFFAHDITETKQMELKLRQAQKLEAIGQLAAGIAHEINTPTQFIGDNIDFLKNSFRDLVQILRECLRAIESSPEKGLDQKQMDKIKDLQEEADLEFLLDEIPNAIDGAKNGIQRVSQIVRAMKEFSHPGGKEKTAVDLNRAIESTITVARNEWKYVADMETDFDPNLPPVPCLLGDFNQVVLNLIVNSAHAIDEVLKKDSSEKGIISISTRFLPDGTNGKKGDWAEIRVADTGGGIPKDVQERIFDPFFTTKKHGKGTGQGLAISRTVITEQHQGTITFETQKGEGTTFIVSLPIVQSETSASLQGGSSSC